VPSRDPGGTEPMFDVPEVYRRPSTKADPALSKWAKYTGKPISCDLCIMNIHDGISDTVLSKAKHTLLRGERRWLFCSIHATQVRNGERKV
jgi:hypothetical protein